MVKVVDKGERVCSITLDGTESSITFQEAYKYFAVQNNSDTDIIISLKRGFSPVDDGVMTVVAGSSVLFPHMRSNVNQFFVKGTGKIQVCAANEPINPFVNAPTKSSGGGTEGDYYTKAQSDAKYVQASSLADVATSGRYSDLKGTPEKLPADGGNADTVGGHTVGCDVPENAVFTPPDLSGYAMLSDIPSSLPANGGNADTVGGVGIANLRQITQTVINTLPAVPNGEGDFLVNCDTSDTSFPYWYGHLSIRYGSYTGEYVAIFRTTGNDNKVYYNTYLTNHWSGWQEISATPIKSTQISGTTSTTGNVQLWAADDKRIPIAAVITDRYAYIFRSSLGIYCVGIFHPDNHIFPADEAVNGTVYYIEKTL